MNYDQTQETFDYTLHSEGCVIHIRQADIGWEYKSSWHDWRKANNREQALEFARQDAISEGKAHGWREKGEGNPHPTGTTWTAPPSKTRRSFSDLVIAYLKQIR